MEAWGPQHWWPAETPFEVIVGAILTQNTAWTNVEKALLNLRREGFLSVAGIRQIPPEALEPLLRPAGYFRQKAARLKVFVSWLDSRYGGSLKRMFSVSTVQLRDELLALNGIGPETADSILLYAGQHEIFVVDAYTRRVFERHNMASSKTSYDEIRSTVEAALKVPFAPVRKSAETGISAFIEPGPGPSEEQTEIAVHPPSKMSEAGRSELAQRCNEFHALIVQVGKHFCQSRVAKCENCPLRSYLPETSQTIRTCG
jgi:endonuclease-3 related protein